MRFYQALVSLSFILGLACASGCRTDWVGQRHSAAEAYRSALQEDTAAILAGFPEGLDLTNCVVIAKERNTRLAASQIAEKVAQMDRKAAFSVFLPQMQVTYNALSLSEEPLRRFGENSVPMQDKNSHETSIQIVQPLFAPSAWLLYRSAKRGAEIASLAQERTEQMIELSVVSAFYNHGSQVEQLAQLETEEAAARQLLRESEAMAREGYVTDADLSSVRVLLMERTRGLDTARRDVQLSKSRLLQLMNLWPLAEIKLKTDTLLMENNATYVVENPGRDPLTLSAQDLTNVPVEEWMFHALVFRKDMQIQDRTVALRRNETLRALAMFIPNLVGFANYYRTSDSYTVNQEYWGTGLQASLSSFVGFRDVAAYLKARQESKGSYVEREEMAMTILVQVVEAYKNLVDTKAALDVTEAAHEAARKTLVAAEAEHRTGLMPLSQLLQARASHSQALTQWKISAFLHAMALHAFRNVEGGGIIPVETPPRGFVTP